MACLVGNSVWHHLSWNPLTLSLLASPHRPHLTVLLRLPLADPLLETGIQPAPMLCLILPGEMETCVPALRQSILPPPRNACTRQPRSEEPFLRPVFLKTSYQHLSLHTTPKLLPITVSDLSLTQGKACPPQSGEGREASL